MDFTLQDIPLRDLRDGDAEVPDVLPGRGLLDGGGPLGGFRNRCAAVYRLRLLVLLVALTIFQYGVVGPSLPYIVNTFFAARHGGGDCEDTPSSDPCRRGAADATLYHGVSGGISKSVAWLLALGLGSWSDVIGRRPLFRSKALVSVLPIAALAVHSVWGVSLWLYLVFSPIYEAYDINGVFLALMSDVITDPEERTAVFGMFMATLILVAGCVLPIASLIPQRAGVILSLITSALKLIYVFTIFPETVPVVAPGAKPQSLLGTPAAAFRIFTRNSFIFRMVLVLVISGLAIAGIFSVVPPFWLAYIGVKRQMIGVIGGLGGASMIITFVVVLGPMVARFGNVRALQASLFACLAYSLLSALASEVWHICVLSFALAGPCMVQIPVISAIKSNLVNEHEQGLVQGLLAAVRVIAVASADIFFGFFYRYITDDGKKKARSAVLPAFALILGLCLLSLLLGLSLPRTPPPPTVREDPSLELAAIRPADNESLGKSASAADDDGDAGAGAPGRSSCEAGHGAA